MADMYAVEQPGINSGMALGKSVMCRKAEGQVLFFGDSILDFFSNRVLNSHP